MAACAYIKRLEGLDVIVDTRMKTGFTIIPNDLESLGGVCAGDL